MQPVEARLRALIHQQGPITFAQFMQEALFASGTGYYSSPRHLEQHGDYFTSPAAHPLFGTLLAIQLQQMWELLEEPPTFTVIELGAGSGQLAAQITSAHTAVAPAFSSALRYVAVDRFAPAGLSASGAAGDPQTVVAQGIPVRGVVGCLLSNELLDAFPVHRFQVHDGRIREVFVTLEGGGFAETLDEPSTPEIPRRVDEAVEAPLPEGFRGEVCLLMDPWVGQVAAALRRGFVLTVDYGDTARGLYSLRRSKGTLQCYYRHTVSADPYVRVGRQDITAHVDFGAVMEAGRRHGLADIVYTSQGEFLANLGAQAFAEALEHRARHAALPQRALLANRMAMTELLRAEGLGGFRVLAQGKDVGSPTLWGFEPRNPKRRELEERTATLAAPLLSDAHTPLLEGRYPHQAWDPGDLWPWSEEGARPPS